MEQPLNKHVLVVVDMQNDFVTGSLGSKEAEAIVDNVVQRILEFDGLILYTLDTHTDRYLETKEGKKLPVEHCIAGPRAGRRIRPFGKRSKQKTLRTSST